MRSLSLPAPKLDLVSILLRRSAAPRASPRPSCVAVAVRREAGTSESDRTDPPENREARVGADVFVACV